MNRRPVMRQGVAAAALLGLLVSGCTVGVDSDEPADQRSGATGGSGDGRGAGDPGASGSTGEAGLSVNIRKGATGVPVSTLVRAKAAGAVITEARLSSESGEVPGEVAEDGASWTAGDRLEPGVGYQLVVRAETEDGETLTRKRSFTSQALALSDQTFASVSPLAGETVGVGMPVVVNFDIPVTDRAEMERHMHVRSTPQQAGTWSWLSDSEVHWRPKRYWKPDTDVVVDLDINGVDAGNGIYGQDSRTIGFTVGEKTIIRVDAQTHRMKVFTSGKLIRTLPITTGKPGFTTRSGIKVIMGKDRARRMNSETVGIAAGSAESYDIANVEYAMRLTNSGEFIHAAPWSVGSQGSANVSHGCTGMSTADAGWLYNRTKRGDVVEYTGTDRPMEPTNGYGDWNVDFADYRAGSAL